MEQETYETKPKSVLHQVTPLSKYLAMALFIAMPFIGGWIGYTYAPEKVVEVERVVVREVVKEVELQKDTIETSQVLETEYAYENIEMCGESFLVNKIFIEGIDVAKEIGTLITKEDESGKEYTDCRTMFRNPANPEVVYVVIEVNEGVYPYSEAGSLINKEVYYLNFKDGKNEHPAYIGKFIINKNTLEVYGLNDNDGSAGEMIGVLN